MAAAGTVSVCFLRYIAVFAVFSSLVISVSAYCSSQFDCSYDHSCCGNICVYGTDCLGRYCSDDSDCRSWENCCEGTCSDDDCFNDGAIVGIVIGVSAVLLCLLSLCIYCTCRPNRLYRGRVVVQPGVTATTVTTRCTTQSNTPYQYQGQVPPPYQQSYLYHPPPQYVQFPAYDDRVAKSGEPPPPYNGGPDGRYDDRVAKSGEPPPPYNGAPDGRSGGVYASQSNYGAVHNPTAQHFAQ